MVDTEIAILRAGAVTTGPASSGDPPKNRKRGRPMNDENTERRRQHQVQLLRRIQLRTAKTNTELEVEFKIGPESGGINGNQGKAWRRWANGENLCRAAVLRTITKIAVKRGWLSADDLEKSNGATDEAPLADLVALSSENWKHVTNFRHRCELAYLKLTVDLKNYERLLNGALSEGHEILDAKLVGKLPDDSAEIEVNHLSEKELQAQFSEAQTLIRKLGCLSVSWRFLREEQLLTERQRQLIKNEQDQTEQGVRRHVVLDLE